MAVLTVTPEIASDWLALNTHNRPLRDKRVQRLARQMEDGIWQLNGEAIKFNSTGNRLLDGQYRLSAIAMTGVAIRSAVVWGVPENAFETMDSGTTRSVSDALALLGEVNTAGLAAALSLYWRYERREMVGAYVLPTTHDCLELLERNPQMRDAVKVAMKVSSKAKVAQSVIATSWYLFSRIDPEAAGGFMESLSVGANLGPDDAILRLRARFIANYEARTKLWQGELLALTIKAWNLWRVGKPTKVLSWRFRGGEPFPEPQG